MANLKRISFFLLAASITAPLAAAQSQPASAPAAAPGTDAPVTTLNVQAREVVLPVTVRDKKGQIVPGLKQEDFTLEQDGRAQTIKSFSNQSSLPFRIGLLVDTSRSEENALPSEKTATGKFIDQMLAQPADKAFLLHFDREVELLQDFTSVKTKLHRELDGMTTSAGGNDDQASSRPSDSDEKGGGQRKRRGGTQMYDAIYLACNELMQKEPGRKAIILLSDGVDRGSKETMTDAVDAAEKANVSVYTVYFKGESQNSGFGEPGMHRGGGYPGGGYPGGYPGGSRMPRPGSGEEKVDGKKILEQIAKRTGGIPFEAKKKDSFEEVYDQIAQELRGQYLLTYAPDKPASKDDSDGFHKISLRAKDEKYIVITREGYYSQD